MINNDSESIITAKIGNNDLEIISHNDAITDVIISYNSLITDVQ